MNRTRVVAALIFASCLMLAIAAAPLQPPPTAPATPAAAGGSWLRGGLRCRWSELRVTGAYQDEGRCGNDASHAAEAQQRAVEAKLARTCPNLIGIVRTFDVAAEDRIDGYIELGIFGQPFQLAVEDFRNLPPASTSLPSSLAIE